jgi:microcystin-dependent protein
MNADGWALCNGTSITSQVTNADITGYTPNLAGKTLVGVGTFASTTTFNLGDDNIYRYDSSTYLGEVRHTLSVYEMPSHSHGVKWQNADWESGGDRRGDGTIYPQSKSNVTNSTSYIQSAGNGQAHNNMPPFYVVQYYMKVRCSTDSK